MASTAITDRDADKVVTTTTAGTKEALDVNLVTGDISIGAVEIKDGTTDTRAIVDSTNSLKVFDAVANALVPEVYDYISLVYTGSNLTSVLFKTGGAGGSTVSTLTLAYDGSDNLTSVTKT